MHLSDCAVKIWHRFLVRELADCHRHSAVWKLWNGILKKANCSAPSTTSRGHVSLVKKIRRCSGARLLSVWEEQQMPLRQRGALDHAIGKPIMREWPLSCQLFMRYIQSRAHDVCDCFLAMIHICTVMNNWRRCWTCRHFCKQLLNY